METGQAAMTHDRPPVAITDMRPQIHPDLAAAIHWCIEPELDKRCPSMEAFLTKIRSVRREDR